MSKAVAAAGDRLVTWKDAAFAVVALFMLLAGFAVWLLGSVSSEVDEKTEAPKQALERVEHKVDKLIFMMLEDHKGHSHPPE
jgi:hypothetical protein